MGTINPSITNCTFRDNYAGSYGGAIVNNGESGTIDISIINCTFSNNSAGDVGGAIYNGPYLGTNNLSITNCIFANNKSKSGGNAIYLDREARYANKVTITNCIFKDNIQTDNDQNAAGITIYGYGDAIECYVVNSLFVGNGNNHIYYDGDNSNSDIRFTNCTFSKAKNRVIQIGTSGRPIDFTNCIFWANNGISSDASHVNITHSIVEEASYAGSNGNIHSDPLFVDTTKGNYHLQSISPAINAGNNDSVPTEITFDLDSNKRIVAGVVDMGVYEKAPIALCKSDTTFYLASNGLFSIDSNALDSQSMEKIASFRLSQAVFSCADASDTISVYTYVKDSSNNEDSCLTKVLVLDTIPPAITCVSDTTVYLTSSGSFSFTDSTSLVKNSFDSCGVFFRLGRKSFNRDDYKDTIKVFTYVNDSSNNEDSCFTQVLVLDTFKYKLYVDSTAVGNNNGTSWVDAFTDLQSALKIAKAGDTVFVAQGTYKPTGGTNRGTSFHIPDSVVVLGGYPNGGGVRDFSANPTILSGDIGAIGTNTDNSYHVVYTTRVSKETVVDGFTIRDGYATYGGGWYNNATGNVSSPTIRNCTFSDNYASNRGGAIFNDGILGTVKTSIINCTFIDNYAANRGGAIYNEFDAGTIDLSIINCRFSNNSAGDAGGAIFNSPAHGTSNLSITNCIFANNKSKSEGSAVFIDPGAYYANKVTITNCIFKDNIQTDNDQNASGIFIYGFDGHGHGNLIECYVVNSLFVGNGKNHIYYSGDATDPLNSDIRFTNCTFSKAKNRVIQIGTSGRPIDFTNCIFWANNGISSDASLVNITHSIVEEASYAGSNGNIHSDPLFVDTTNNNYHLQSISPAINAGNNDSVPTEITFDLDSNKRIVAGVVDMGVYEKAPIALCKSDTTFYLASNGLFSIDSNALDSQSMEKIASFRLSQAVFSCADASDTISVYTYVQDSSNNEDSCLTRVLVLDTIPPAITCVSDTTVYLTSSGSFSFTDSTSLLKNSFDSCGVFFRLGRKSFNRDDYKDTIKVFTYVNDSSNNEDSCFTQVLVLDTFKYKLYVDSTAVGNNDGTSWVDAFTDLQSALKIAKAGDTVFVAQGTYKPTGGSDRTISFHIPDSVVVLGGYPNGGGVRDFSANPTILSGDIGTIGTNTDNTSHVVYTTRVSKETVVDGFTIRDGYTTDGGGWYNDGSGAGNASNPTIQNCTFRDNYAGTYGGAIYNNVDAGTIDISIINCTFSNNSTDDEGGAIFNDPGYNGTTNLSITNCIFTNNKSKSNGSAIIIGADEHAVNKVTITNCIFKDNIQTDNDQNASGITIYGYGDIIECYVVNSLFVGNGNNHIYYTGDILNSDIRFTNCTFSKAKNRVIQIGYSTGRPIDFTNCIFWANNGISSDASHVNITHSIVEEASYAGSNGNIHSDPLFVDTTKGNYHLQSISPAINAGNNDSVPAEITFDLDSNKRIVAGVVDMGVYEKAPIALCKSDTTFYLASNGLFSIDSNALDSQSMEKIASFRLSQAVFSCADASDTISVYTYVNDSSNNEDSCLTKVLVLDTIPPAITCVSDTTVYLTSSGAFSFTDSTSLVKNSFDSCGVSFRLSQASFSCADASDTISVYTYVQDSSNNEDSCLTKVLVLDTILPTITCVSDTTIYLTSSGSFSFTDSSSLVKNSFDSCGVFFRLGRKSFNRDDYKDTIKVFTYVNDSSNNEDSCFTQVLVLDTFKYKLYVDSTAVGNNNGTSWVDAFTDLQSALKIAKAGDTVFVAQGTYKPTGGTNRDTSFHIPDSVVVLGGYPNGGGVRDFSANPTILSGDIGTIGTNTDNSYHVVYTTRVSKETVVDGFTIRDGYTTKGGGWYNDGSGAGNVSSPTIRNCTFSDNYAGSYGGAIYNEGTYGTINPSITNCTFSDNYASYLGGAIVNNGESGTIDISIINCTFSNNSVGDVGGAIYNGPYLGTNNLSITNCIFANNKSKSGGNAIYLDRGAKYANKVTITNCIFRDNIQTNNDKNAAGITIYGFDENGNGNLIECYVVNSLFVGNGNNHIYYSGDATDILNSAIRFTNCTFSKAKNRVIQIGTSGRPIDFTNCIFWANNGISSDDSRVNITHSIVEEASYAGSNGNIHSDPLFVDTTNNNFHLQSISPAINAGNNDSVPTEITFDLDSNKRIVAGVVDMGVYEKAPIALCKSDTTFYLASNGLFSIDSNALDSQSGGGIASFRLSQAVFSCADASDTISVYTYVQDSSNNEDSCLTKVLVLDTIPPTITCVSDTTVYLTSSGSFSFTDSSSLVKNSFDSCGVSFRLSQASFSCADASDTISVYTYVKDSSNNEDSCLTKVLVLDTILPAIICVSDTTVYLTSSGSFSFTDSTSLVKNSFDSCGVSFRLSQASFSCADASDTISVYTYVKDSSNNEDSCLTKVLVLDTILSAITCVSDTTVYLTSSGAFSFTDSSSLVKNSFDSCGVSFRLSQASFSCADASDTISVYTYVKDSSNNEDSCLTKVLVLDTILPAITCVSDTTVYLTSSGSFSFTDSSSLVKNSFDSCGVFFRLSQASFSCADASDTISVYTYVQDSSNNEDSCLTKVLVLDTILSAITCVSDTTVYLTSSGSFSFTDSTSLVKNSFDSCGVFFRLSQASFSCADASDTISVYTYVKDSSNNEDSCLTKVLVLDTILSAITCVSDTTVYLTSSGAFSFTDSTSLVKNSFDSCGVSFRLSQASFSCADASDTISVYTYVNDSSNNEDSCLTKVLVLDTIPPTITCVSDTTVYLTSSGAFSFTDSSSLVKNSFDSCGVSFRLSQASFSCADASDTISVYTYVQDSSNNEDSCLTRVLVLDTILPAITCVSDTTVYLTSSGAFSFTDSTSLVKNSFDSCGVSFRLSQASFSCADASDTISVYTYVKDSSNNEDSCLTKVLVLDTISLSFITIAPSNDTSICLGESIVLTATGSDSIWWNNNVQNGVEFFPTNTAEYIASSINPLNRCKVSDMIKITVKKNPEQISIVADNEKIFRGEAVNLSVDKYTLQDDISWNTGDKGSPILVYPDSTKTYIATINSSNCFVVDSIEIEVIQWDVDLGKDLIVCEAGQLVNLKTSSKIPEATYQWNTGDTIPEISVRIDTSPTELSLISTVGNYSVADTMQVSISDLTFKEKPYKGCFNFIDIEPEKGNPPYQYSINGIDYQKDNRFLNIEPMEYILYVKDDEGCSIDTLIFINSIIIPNYFSPNGDGINDTWSISSLDGCSNAVIYIIDRYSRKLYEMKTTDKWDGIYKGTPLKSGAYWYMLEFNDGINNIIRNSITIKRE